LIVSFFSRRSKKTLSSQLEGGVFFLLILITVIFIFLAFFSLSYHNRNATNGYQLKVLREERAQVMKDIEELDMVIADLSAINQKKTEEEDEFLEEEQTGNRIIYLTGKKH
jgi:uncharacterized protein YpmS